MGRVLRRAVAVAAGAGAALAGLSAASAAGSGLDPTFGNGGTVVTPLGGPAQARSLAVQPDGKLLAAVQTRGAGAVLVRYRRDGTLDAAFGNAGRVPTAGTLTAVEPNGRIVVGGTVDGDFVLRRHRPDGSLDAAFGEGGTVRTDLGGTELLSSILLQPGGRIVAVGTSSSRGVSQLAFARYLDDGSLDPAFGRGGRLVGWDGVARGAALAPGGGIVAAGSRSRADGSFDRLVVVKVTRLGVPDRSFAADGVATASATRSGGPFPTGVAVQPDGKVVVANVEVEGSALGVVRFTAEGALDRTFGNGAPAADERIYGYRALAVDRRGRIVLAGSGPDVFESALVARLTPAGRLDERFGRAGVATAAFGRRADGNAVALQPDGKVVVAGWAGTWLGTDDMQVALARHLPTTCAVPGVRGRTLAAARRAIERRGCAPGRTALAHSARVPRGRVISQRPAAGSRVADHVPVTLVVSRGPR